MSNLVDTNGLRFFDAPLETFSESEMRGLNKEIIEKNGVGFGAINPYLYNKTCLLDCHLEIQAPVGGAYINYFDGGANSVEAAKMNVCGQTLATFEHVGNQSSSPRTFGNPFSDDYAIYVELAPISSIAGNGCYDNIEMIGTGYKQHYQQIGNVTIETTPFAIMGKMAAGIVNKHSNLKPIPTHNYDNWVYVKKFVVYNRTEGSANSRTPIRSGTSDNSNIYPCILFNCQNLYHYRYNSGKPKLFTFNNSFNGIIIANLMSQFSPLWQLGDWRMINATQVSNSGVTDEFLSTLTQVIHKSKLGENIKLLKPFTTDDNIEPWLVVGSFFEEEPLYIFRARYSDQYNKSYLAFKSFDDLKWLLADWGFTKVSNDLETVQNMPSELFPGYTPPEGVFNPDGGSNTGYDDNKPISDIPSYSDNTSDTIKPVTPNISAINAASVYALNITSVKTLLNWLMSENFTKNISELFSDKLSALDDLKLFPFDIAKHDLAHTQASTSLTLANVTNEAVDCYKLLPNYNCIINGGSYHYTAYWGNFNDYTAASYYLYVPYGGIVELSPSHVVNRDLSVIYALDIMTGNATAIIYSNGVLVKTVPCQIGQTIPITYTNTNQREIRNTLTALNAGTSIINMAAGKADILSGVLGVVNSAATTAMTNPLKIGSIGNFSSGTSLIMPQNPFLIISRIQQAIPAKRQEVIGIPSNINTKISSFVGSGYVQIKAAHISTSATTEEQNQIINLLRNGIFI